MQRLIFPLAVLLAFATGSLNVAAQGATPAAGGSPGRIVPDPAECTLTPVSLARLQALAPKSISGLATPAATPAPLPTGGQPADAATVAGVTATIRQGIACTNARDNLRLFAIADDAFLRQYLAHVVAQVGPITQAVYGALARSQPRAAADREALLDVRNVRVLPDGRVTALITSDDPTRAPRVQTRLGVFVKVGDRWLVDETIPVSRGGALGGTPAP